MGIVGQADFVVKKLIRTKGLRKILNSMHETLNKNKGSKSQCPKQDLFVPRFAGLGLGFVWDLDIGI